MSSIWTPSGEYQPGGEDDGPGAGGAGDAPGTPFATGPDVSDEELDALRRVHEQLRATPAIDIVANHVVQLFQLALVYLGAGGAPTGGEAPVADLVQASLVIDAMAAIIDGLGPRLAEHEQTLRDALGQLQLVWVEIADQAN